MVTLKDKQTEPLGVLTKLPVRNQSLSRPQRKHVPDAIILPDPFDTDIAYDIDDYLNDDSSPDIPYGKRSIRSVKSPDNANRLAQRPGSAGLLSPRGSSPPLNLHPRARSSSVDSSPSIAELNVATPTRAISNPNALLTVSNSSSSNRTARPVAGKQDPAELVAKRIKEALTDASMRGDTAVKFDREFVEFIFSTLQSNREKLQEIRDKLNGIRVSHSSQL
jgi:hypothetical protein